MTADNNTCHRIKKFCWRSNPKSPGLLFWVFYFRRTEFSTGAIKEKRNSYCSLISCNHQEKQKQMNLTLDNINMIYLSLDLFCLAKRQDKGCVKRRVSECVYLYVWAGEICTECVTQTSFYTSCVYLTDASFMLWFHKHSQSDIPKGMYCHLQEKHTNTLTICSHQFNTF